MRAKNKQFLNPIARIFHLFFLLLPSLHSRAQLIDTQIAEPSISEPAFNPRYIKAYKIKRITLNIANKPDLQVIDDKGLVQCYEFDTAGRLIRSYYTTILSQEKVETFIKPVYRRGRKIQNGYTDVSWKYTYDTSFTWLAYDSSSRPIMKRSSYGNFFNTWYYEYNKEGKMSREINCRETNKNLNKHDFMLGVQTVLSSERFEYLLQSPTQVKKLCYNDDEKVYKQEILNRDSNTVEENYSFIVGYVRYANVYKYTKNGRLSEKNNFSNSNGDVKLRVVYEYDDKGNLAGEKRYQNDVNTHVINYLYDETQALVKSRLDRDFAGSSILITRFSYEFYP